MSKKRIETKNLPKHKGINKTGEGPDILSSLEKQVSELYKTLNTGIGSLFFGVKDLGKKESSSAGSILNSQSAKSSILGSTDSIYSYLKGIHEIYTGEKDNSLLTKINNSLSIIKTALSPDDNVETIYSLLSNLISSDNEQSKYEGKVKFLVEGLDNKSIDKLNELFKLGDQSQKELLQSLNELYLVLSRFGSFDDKNIKGLDNAAIMIGRLIPILTSIRVANKLSPKSIENFANTIGQVKNIFDNLSGIKALDKNTRQDIISSIHLLYRIACNLLLMNKTIKNISTAKMLEFIGNNNDKNGLSGIFYNISDLQSIDAGKAEKINLTVDWLKDTVNTFKLLGNVYKESNKDIEQFISGFNGLAQGDLKDLFTNTSKLPGIDVTEKEFILDNVKVIDELIRLLNESSSKYNHNVINDFVNQFSILLKTNGGQDLYTVFDKVSEMGGLEDHSKKLLNKLLNITEIIDTIEKLKITNNLQSNTKQLNDFFGGENSGKNLQAIFDGLKKIKFDKDKFKELNETIGSLASIIKVFSEISKNSKDSKHIKENLENYLKAIKESYEQISKNFELIIATGNQAELIKEANEKINSAQESTNKVINNTAENQTEVAKANITMEDIAAFVVASATVLIVGALVVMLGGGKFVKAALEFGVVLMTFEALVLAPALMFVTVKQLAMPSMKEFSAFIITCTFVMTLGALFMMLGGGKFIKAALEFGLTLMIFETLVVAPMLVFSVIKPQAIPSLKEFTLFVVACTFVMLLGGLFVNLGGGKFLKSALMFGVYLMAFEAMVVAPMLLFGLVSNIAKESIKDFTKFIITCTFVLILGAVFMMSKKIVQGAVKFAALLFFFELATITPFLLFRLIRDVVVKSVRDFTSLIIASTFCLVLGAVFMMSDKLVKGAMEFTWLLMKFEFMVIAPFILFNIIKPFALSGLKEFTKFVLVSTFCLILGAVFMQNKKFVQGAKEFKDLLFWFVLGMTSTFILYRIFSQIAEKSLKQFTLFILGATFCLVLGAMFIKMFGSGPVWEYTLILGLFVGAMGGIVIWLTKNMGKKSLFNMQMFAKFILLSSAALGIGALFIATFGSGPVWEYAGLLTGFVLAMGLIIKFLLKNMNPLTIASMEAFGFFVLLGSAALCIGTMFIKKYGWDNALLFTVVLSAFILAMSVVMAALTFMSPFMGVGEAVLAALAGCILLMTGAFFLVNLFFTTDPGGKILMSNLAIINSLLAENGALYMIFDTLTGWWIIKATLGGVAATAIGISIGILGTALGIVNLIIGGKGKQLKENIGILNELIGEKYLGKTFAYLGSAIISITFGAVVATAMSVSLLLLGGAITLTSIILGKNPKKIENNILKLNDIIIAIRNVFQYIKDKFSSSFIITSGLKITAISATAVLLASMISDISKSVSQMRKAGDISKYQDSIVNNIKSFFSIIEKIKDDADKVKEYEDTIKAVENICLPMAKMMAKLSKSVKDMADMKIAIAWDAKGNPTGYRHLKDKDFDLMTRNVGTVVTSMTEAIMKAYVKQFQCGNKVTSLADLVEDDDVLKNVIKFNKELGNVIAGIAKAVGSMASLKIPTKWDENGHPIAFRSLKEKDFINAQENVGKIITNMTTALIGVYSGNEEMFKESEGGILRGSKKSPLRQVISISMELSELIGEIGSAIGNISKLTIPIKWENGKAVNYRTLKGEDFTNASTNIQTILSTMFTSLKELYDRGTEFSLDGSNVFDFNKDKPNGLFKVIEASMNISELIANVGESIQLMAKMMVPDKWDHKTGKPIHYRKLTETDFIDTANSIKTIITTTAEALKSINIPDHEEFQKVIESLLPASELIANMSENIVKLATGQIPTRWNKDGKPIWFKKLTEKDYEETGKVIHGLMTSIADALVKSYLGDKANGKKGLQQLIEGKDFKETVEAFQGVSSIVANMADGVIKFASAQIPDQWDKDGKAIHYKDIKNWKEIQENLTSVLNQIITCVVTSVIDAYKNNEQLFEGGEDSPFMLAVNGIQGVTKIVSGMVDSVVKLGTAQIPTKWDKDGKPIWYEKININSTISNIKKIFQGDKSGEGLLTILCNQIDTISKTYFTKNADQYIGDKLEDVTSGLTSILEVVKLSVGIITDVANLKIPIGFDKDGKATAYKKFNESQMNDLQENISSIITGLFISVNKAWNEPGDMAEARKNLTKENLEIITNTIESVTDVISTILSGLNEVIANDNSLKSIVSYNGICKSDKQFALGLFKDIYTLVSDMNLLVSELTGENNIIDKLFNLNIDNEKRSTITSKLSDTQLLINSILENYVEIKKSFEANSNNLSNLLDINQINDIIKIYNALSTLYSSTNGASSFGGNVTLDRNILLSSQLFDESVSYLVNAIDNSKGITTELVTNLKNNLETLVGIFDNEIKTSGIGPWAKTNLELMNEPLDEYVGIVIKFDNKAQINSAFLNNSINKIYKATSEQKSAKIFKENTEVLKKYVKAINNVEVKKLSPLVMLVSELNTLANKMGNLDGLTTAISDKLASVLNELVKRLEESKETFERADKIQSDRYRKITETVGKVQEIMAQPFNVAISTAETPISSNSPIELDEGKEYSYDDLISQGLDTSKISREDFNKAAGKNGKLSKNEAQNAARNNTNFVDILQWKKKSQSTK